MTVCSICLITVLFISIEQKTPPHSWSIHTTATAEDWSISMGVNTAKYAMLATKYTDVTIAMEIIIARGKFLEPEMAIFTGVKV